MASRHVWLGLTALSKKDREDLLGAPVSTEGLFGSVSSVTQRVSRLEEERVQLSHVLPPAPPPQGPRDFMQGRERSATVKRRERRRHRAAAPSTSTAHPVAPAYRRSRGRAAQLRQAPQQQRAPGLGAPSSRSRLAGGGSASVGGEIPSTGDARANPAWGKGGCPVPCSRAPRQGRR